VKGNDVANQLIPEPGMEPAVPEKWTPELGIALWADLMDACDELLLAGLRREVGPGGDLEAAYRRWYGAQMEEHDRAVDLLVSNMNRRLRRHGR
jgi:hypothetical protein